MDLAVSLNGGFAILILLGAVGAILIAGGFVAYRGSDRVWVKTIAAAAMAAGAVVWTFILWITPVSAVRGG